MVTYPIVVPHPLWRKKRGTMKLSPSVRPSIRSSGQNFVDALTQQPQGRLTPNHVYWNRLGLLMCDVMLICPSGHYLSQCWPRSLSPYGVTRPQWVDSRYLAPVGSQNSRARVKWFSRYLALSREGHDSRIQDHRPTHSQAFTTRKQYVER